MFESLPDIYLRVMGAAGQRDIYTTEGAVRWGAGAEERFDFEIPRGVVALDEEVAPPKPPEGGGEKKPPKKEGGGKMKDEEKVKPRAPRPYVVRTAVAPQTEAAADAEGVKVSRAQHPAPQSTLYDLGVVVRVAGGRDLASHVVIHPIDRAALRGIDPATARFFRHDARGGAWRPAWNSGVNLELGYAWAKVREPGAYVLAGLPRDPVLKELLGAVAYSRLYEGAHSPEDAKALTDDVFALLREAPPEALYELRRRLAAVEVQTGGVRADEEVVRGDGGAMQPFALPGGLSFEDFRKRLDEVQPLPGGFPEEALFFSPQLIGESDAPFPFEAEQEGEVFDPARPFGPRPDPPFEPRPDTRWLDRLGLHEYLDRLHLVLRPRPTLLPAVQPQLVDLSPRRTIDWRCFLQQHQQHDGGLPH